jgi:hypothetical protein
MSNSEPDERVLIKIRSAVIGLASIFMAGWSGRCLVCLRTMPDIEKFVYKLSSDLREKLAPTPYLEGGLPLFTETPPFWGDTEGIVNHWDPNLFKRRAVRAWSMRLEWALKPS